jgi:uncharacterized DUF497 family protein
VDITYDPAKNERNIRERGLSFERAADFDFGTAIFWVDARQDYGEVRRLALGYLGNPDCTSSVSPQPLEVSASSALEEPTHAK